MFKGSSPDKNGARGMESVVRDHPPTPPVSALPVGPVLPTTSVVVGPLR